MRLRNWKGMVAILLMSSMPISSRADLFGTDTAVLTQILSQNVKQLIELQQILGVGQDALHLQERIHRGLSESLNLIRTIGKSSDPGLFGELKKLEDIIRRFGEIYGVAIDSPDQTVQSNVDKTVAEAISMNNGLYEYAREMDRVGEEIKSYSRDMSPTGAQKLTAQSLGVMLHVLNQSLRAQGTLLKLQAQSIAQSNKAEKDRTRAFVNVSKTLSQAMAQSSPAFSRPRF